MVEEHHEHWLHKVKHNTEKHKGAIALVVVGILAVVVALLYAEDKIHAGIRATASKIKSVKTSIASATKTSSASASSSSGSGSGSTSGGSTVSTLPSDTIVSSISSADNGQLVNFNVPDRSGTAKILNGDAIAQLAESVGEGNETIGQFIGSHPADDHSGLWSIQS